MSHYRFALARDEDDNGGDLPLTHFVKWRYAAKYPLYASTPKHYAYTLQCLYASGIFEPPQRTGELGEVFLLQDDP